MSCRLFTFLKLIFKFGSKMALYSVSEFFCCAFSLGAYGYKFLVTPAPSNFLAICSALNFWCPTLIALWMNYCVRSYNKLFALFESINCLNYAFVNCLWMSDSSIWFNLMWNSFTRFSFKISIFSETFSAMKFLNLSSKLKKFLPSLASLSLFWLLFSAGSGSLTLEPKEVFLF